MHFAADESRYWETAPNNSGFFSSEIKWASSQVGLPHGHQPAYEGLIKLTKINHSLRP